MVDCLKGHATGEGPVADHRNTFELFTPLVAGQGHPQRCGDGGARVPRAEVVEGALAALQITGDSVLLTQGMEIVVATRDQLVGISLMTHIPDHTVMVEIQGLIQGQGQLNDPETRAEVTSTGAHYLEMTLADLTSDRFELSEAQAVQLIRMSQLAEMHARP
jgi:hypothetical protein